ncbi:MAG: sensor N-terminal transmembrane domain-containing protein [Paracoccaceae bacterium]
MGGRTSDRADVVLGEDWVGPEGVVDSELREGRERRGFISLNRSPLARKIITFNLMAMVVLVAGVLYLNPFRNSLVLQRETGLVAEAQLIADVFEAQLDTAGPVNFVTGDGIDVVATTGGIELPEGVELFIYDATGQLVTSSVGMARPEQELISGLQRDERSTIITDILNRVWDTIEASARATAMTSPVIPKACRRTGGRGACWRDTGPYRQG